MHLISILACGVNGAESGTAEIYVRGTSTRATYYTDYKGVSAISTGADVSLDSNGGAVVYVNQNVDVDVKDSSGSRVRFFTEMAAAPLVEYIGSSFTGTDYTTGASATSKPITLQAILNAWFTSAGAADFNVLLEGASTSIQAALGTVSGLFFNVQSAAYGATGDGTTDDTTAITAAITAATVSGGIVFFPAGTYRVTSSISLPADVSLLGLGSDISIITMDHASNNLLVLSGASSGGFQRVQGIGFTAAQSYSGYLLYGVTEETFARFEGCSFGGANTTTTIVYLDIDHAAIKFESCYFKPGEIDVGKAAVDVDSSGAADDVAWYTFSNCDFKAAASQTATTVYLLYAGQAYVHGCRFDCSAMTNAVTITCLRFFGTVSTDVPCAVAIGNFFIGNGTATVYGIDSVDANMNSREIANSFSGNMAGWYGTTALGSSYAHEYRSKECRSIDLGTDNSAAVTLPTTEYGLITIERSDATVQTLSANREPPVGAWLTVIIRKINAGATGNITFSSTYFVDDGSPYVVAANSYRAFTFRAANRGTGNTLWTLVGATADMT